MKLADHDNIRIDQYIDVVGKHIDELLADLILSGLDRELILLSLISIAKSELDADDQKYHSLGLAAAEEERGSPAAS